MAAILHTDQRVVDRRLRQIFNSTRDQWVKVVTAAVAARAGRTDDDAKAAPGFYAWNAGTAELRRVFCREGYERGDEDGVETVINRELGVMVAVMNADAGAGDAAKTPRNRTLKGSASEKVVDLNNQHELFKPTEMSAPKERACSLWYLCIYDNGETVRAELSRPIEYRGGYIVKFSERIFILGPGDWEKTIVKPADEEPGTEFEISVIRK